MVEQDGQRAVQMKSASDSSNVNKDIRGKVRLAETPILEWTWKVAALPKGADARRAATDDEAAQLYVVWPRFPEALRSQIIGYIWDTTAPVGSVFKSQKSGTVTYVVVRSGPADLGKWVTERRDVREDFKRIYGEAPEDPGGISFGIDSDDVKGTAESYIGADRLPQALMGTRKSGGTPPATPGEDRLGLAPSTEAEHAAQAAMKGGPRGAERGRTAARRPRGRRDGGHAGDRAGDRPRVRA